MSRRARGAQTHEAALDAIAWDERGLVPVVAQDVHSGEVLMLAYANREALERTLASGEAHYHSRSRDALWHKGATSGNVQRVREIRYDCDADAVLYRVEPAGPACHTGARSCFFSVVPGAAAEAPAAAAGGSEIGAAMELLQRVVASRLSTLPEGSYVTRLHGRGLGYAGQKVIEEAGETVVAALHDDDEAFLDEAADLLFHLSVLVGLRGQHLDQVAQVLLERHRERSQADAGATDTHAANDAGSDGTGAVSGASDGGREAED